MTINKKTKENPKMKKSIQKKINKIVNNYVDEWNNHIQQLALKHPEFEEWEKETKESLGILISYSDNGFTIDGDFYSHVREYQEDGMSSSNFLYELWVNIENCVDSLGFYLENYGYGEYRYDK
mgnify:CR=1 FL=1